MGEKHFLLSEARAELPYRLSKAKLLGLIRAGLLKAVRPPGCSRWYVSESELRRFVEAATQSAGGTPAA